MRFEPNEINNMKLKQLIPGIYKNNNDIPSRDPVIRQFKCVIYESTEA